jgi:murein DD-endopeptidase MepM/ murein hydrolase activator NlpD
MAWRHALDKYKRGPVFGVVDDCHPNGHRGTDYNGFKAGTPLKAVNDGVIVLNKFSAVLGNVVVLQVGKQFFGYCHLDKPSPLKVGTKVKSGDVVGGAGTTGSASLGVHLHLTLSLLKEGVFGGKVYDAHAFIDKMIARDKAAAKPKPITSTPVKCCTGCTCPKGCK